MMKIFRDIISSKIIYLYSLVIIAFMFSKNFQSPVKCYTGEIIEISKWEGRAKIKAYHDNDTIILVRISNHTKYQLGDTIIVYTGGNITGNYALIK